MQTYMVIFPWNHYKTAIDFTNFCRENDEITISYTPIVFGEPLKTEHIKSEWNFVCQCSRCQGQDLLSEILCPKCPIGSLTYVSGMEKLVEPWKCSHCECRISAKEIHRTISKYQEELKYEN